MLIATTGVFLAAWLLMAPACLWAQNEEQGWGSSLVILHLGLTARCARLFKWDVFRCLEVSTLVPAADSLSR